MEHSITTITYNISGYTEIDHQRLVLVDDYFEFTFGVRQTMLAPLPLVPHAKRPFFTTGSGYCIECVREMVQASERKFYK